jgi:signal transduction histidine kinase
VRASGNMQQRTNRRQLSSRGARVHFAVAIALTSMIPCLTLLYLYQAADALHSLAAAQWLAAGVGVGGAMLLGYILLWRYPATILRLRSSLRSVVSGELPEAIDLSANEQDIMAIEDALNVVLQKLRQKLQEVQLQKSRLEDELFQAQKLEAIGTLAAGIAHEINTPLQFVSNNARFLEKACTDLLIDLDPASVSDQAQPGKPEAREGLAGRREFLRVELPRAFRQLQEGIARVAQIVKAVRDFAKGEDEGAKVPVDLNKAVATTVEVTRNEWKYHADIETDLDPTLPPLPCFPTEIKRTLMNLILNAVQAIADRGPREGGGKGIIRVATRWNGREAALSVSDDGCGIPAGIRDRIFDPFFTTREVGAGKGCGLAFAHAAVVNRHGGRLSFVTEEDKGSTFTMTIPMAAGIDRGVVAAREDVTRGERQEGEP